MRSKKTAYSVPSLFCLLHVKIDFMIASLNIILFSNIEIISSCSCSQAFDLKDVEAFTGQVRYTYPRIPAKRIYFLQKVHGDYKRGWVY